MQRNLIKTTLFVQRYNHLKSFKTKNQKIKVLLPNKGSNKKIFPFQS